MYTDYFGFRDALTVFAFRFFIWFSTAPRNAPLLLNIGSSMLLPVGTLRLLDLLLCRHQCQHVVADGNRANSLSLS